MKTILYTLFVLSVFSFAATAQTKNMEMKKKFNFMQRYHPTQNQNFRSHDQDLLSNRNNRYWEQINAPHKDSSFIQDIEVPNERSVWGTIGFYNIERPNTIYYVRTKDDGYSWKLDSLPLSTDYGINSLSPLDAYTCYAAVANVFIGGGGIYKTNNGGATWRQLLPAKLFDSTSYPDFVHFWDERHGVAVGDGNGPGTPYFEIYTTSNAGATWQRVPAQNIPTPNGYPFSQNNDYTVAGNRIWFQGFDSNGGHFIYRSDDYGHHWASFPLTASITGTNFIDFAFTDNLNGVANGFDDNGITQIYSTHNGGETWKKVNYSGTPMGLYITAVPGTATFVTTSSFATAVFGSSYSNDNGKTWTLIDSGANALHDDVKFLNSCIGWSGETTTSSSDRGGMFKWIGFLHANSADDAIAVTKDNTTIKVYPNPAKDVITINGLNTSAKTTLSLYNISGTLIQQATANEANHSFNIQNLAAGSYYIKVQSGENLTTLKFVKE